MFDSQFQLLSRLLATVAESLASEPASTQAWATAAEALGSSRSSEPDLAVIIDSKDAVALRGLVAEWSAGTRLLPEPDRALLKRALKAFRKSLKVTRLDEESTIGGGAMSSGRQSGIVGITPPGRFAREVWEELVRQRRLIDGRHGIYELPRE